MPSPPQGPSTGASDPGAAAAGAAPAAGRRVAVIGGGVAGLTAAWVLQRSGASVTLYESDARLGGHAHTHDVVRANGSTVAIDSGFIVHNRRTYPTLIRLFDELGVATQPAEMSMSVRCDGCGLEYAGARGLRALVPNRAAARPAHLRTLRQVPRFHRAARRLLQEPSESGPEQTLADFISAGRYSADFVAHFLRPLVACVWSCAPSQALRYPARYLFAFLANHGMLSVGGSPAWRTVVGGSRSYVDQVAKPLSRVATATPVRSLTRTAHGVQLREDADTVAEFDAAVIATHPDQALRLLERPSVVERAVLGAFEYSVNEAVLHTDAGRLPRTPAARASWNYRMDRCGTAGPVVQVTYDLTRLMALPGPERYLATESGVYSGRS